MSPPVQSAWLCHRPLQTLGGVQVDAEELAQMRKQFLSRVGWVTAEVSQYGAGWTATLVNEHPCLSRLGHIPGADIPAALANLDIAIRRLFIRGDQARPTSSRPR
jgi:hypothetical protein